MWHLFVWLWLKLKHIFHEELNLKEKATICSLFIVSPPIFLGVHIPMDSWVVVFVIKVLTIAGAAFATGACTKWGAKFAENNPNFFILKLFKRKKKIKEAPTEEIYDDKKPKQIWGKNGHDKNGTHN